MPIALRPEAAFQSGFFVPVLNSFLLLHFKCNCAAFNGAAFFFNPGLKMKVARALQWLIDNEPEGLKVKWLGQTVYFNGENVEIERKSCAPMIYTPVDFLRIYKRERFSHRWSQLNYFQRSQSDSPSLLGYAGVLT